MGLAQAALYRGMGTAPQSARALGFWAKSSLDPTLRLLAFRIWKGNAPPYEKVPGTQRVRRCFFAWIPIQSQQPRRPQRSNREKEQDNWVTERARLAAHGRPYAVSMRPRSFAGVCEPMPEQTILSAMLRASDRFRRSAGAMLDQLNMGPVETEWDVMLSEPGFTLRRYGNADEGAPPVLLVPAPIKRPYIFDLMPTVSVVRCLQDNGFSVYLVDWREANADADWGLAQYAVEWIGMAEQTIGKHRRGKPVLIGHSLGGTFAAIFAAAEPERVGKLLLIEAPLRFGADAGALAPIVGISPRAEAVTQLTAGVPGSLLDIASCVGAPEEFIAGRWQDAAACALDADAWSIHQRVIRWSLDEFAQPSRLFAEIIELLYRGDAFARGDLELSGRTIAPAGLALLAVAAVIDPSSRLVPPVSALAPLAHPAVFMYEPETGVALQHVGPLVGRRAHRELWPRLTDWLKEPMHS